MKDKSDIVKGSWFCTLKHRFDGFSGFSLRKVKWVAFALSGAYFISLDLFLLSFFSITLTFVFFFDYDSIYLPVKGVICSAPR